MWQIYRKRFIKTQLFIAAVCLLLYFVLGWSDRNVLFTLGVMQAFSILGAVMGARLDRFVELNKRR